MTTDIAPASGTDLTRGGYDGPVEVRVDGGRAQDPGSVELAELLRTTDVVSVDPTAGYMVVTDRVVEMRDPGIGVTSAIQEMGYTAPSPFTSWTRRDENTKLHDQNGIRVYYNMRRQDGAVRGAQRLLKTPVMGAHWFVEPFVADEADEVATVDKTVAKFVEDNLFLYLNVSWSTLLADILLMTDYGYMAFEKVYVQPMGPSDKVRDGKMRLQKLGARHPLDIQEWIYDSNGGPNGCKMYTNPYSGPSPLGSDSGMGPPSQPERWIPISKLVVFTHEAEAGDLTGISVLRSAYKHWFYKDTMYKIDAIQKERHGIGIPVIKLPPGFTPRDKALAENLGRNLRTNERAHVTLPPMWDLLFAKLEGQPVDCLKSIDHHDMRIKSNVLGSFLDAVSGTSDPNIDIFLKSTRYLADQICDTFNTHVIPQLVDLNFKIGPSRGYPRLRARRIGEWEDMRTLSFAVRNLVGVDVLRADDVLEAHLRREMDLPPADQATARTPVLIHPSPAAAPETGTPGDVSQPALPGQARSGTAPNGQPTQDSQRNQGGAPRQRSNPPTGKPSGNTGTDRSGG